MFSWLKSTISKYDVKQTMVIKGSITRWQNVVYKIFKTLWRSNSIEFLIHGTSFNFTLENKYINFIWSNSISRKILIFNMWRLSGKKPSCYRHFKIFFKMTSLLKMGNSRTNMINNFWNTHLFNKKGCVRSLNYLVIFVLNFKVWRLWLFIHALDEPGPS